MNSVAEVVRSILLPAGVERVWAGLTQGERLSEWFGARVEIEARRGGRASFTWPDGSNRQAVVEVLEPNRLLVLRWLPFERDHSGVTRPRPAGAMRFVVEPQRDGCRLRVMEARDTSELGPTLALAHTGTEAR